MYMISVIVPFFNGQKYLSTCVSCLNNQEIDNMEIILVDDGSTDDSLKIAKQIESEYKNVKFVCKKHSGLSDTRNVGFQHATGKYVYFLDVDDFLEKNALKKAVELAERNMADIVVFDSLNVAEELNSVNGISDIPQKYKMSSPYAKRSIKPFVIYSGIDFATDSLMSEEGFFPPVWLGIYNREFLIREKIFFCSIIHEDNIYSMDACLSAKSIVYLPDILHYRRVVSNSITHGKKTKKHIEGSMEVVKYNYQLYKKFSQNKKYRIAFKRWSILNSWNVYTELKECERSIQKYYKLKCLRYFIIHIHMVDFKLILKLMVL